MNWSAPSAIARIALSPLPDFYAFDADRLQHDIDRLWRPALLERQGIVAALPP
jgi:hypothetical protein